MAWVMPTESATIISLAEFFDAIMNYDIIFLGEVHDSREIHEAELSILAELAERDVQDVLDDYLEGNISEDEFLESARPWQNYHQDYRPLVELAKAKGIFL